MAREEQWGPAMSQYNIFSISNELLRTYSVWKQQQDFRCLYLANHTYHQSLFYANVQITYSINSFYTLITQITYIINLFYTTCGFRRAPRGGEGGVLHCPNFWSKFCALFLLKISYFVPYFDLICTLFLWNHNSKIAIWNNLASIIFKFFPTAPTNQPP